MGTIETLLKVTADSRQVAAGFKPMMTSLEQAQVAAEGTEAALDSIGVNPIKVNINDEAIAKARAEILKLRNQMREQLSTDVNADTSEAQKQIKKLQQSIKVLDTEKPVIDVGVRTTRLDSVLTTVTDIQDAVGGSGGAGGLVGGLGLASRGIGSLGGEAAAAAGPIGAAGAAMVVAAGGAYKLGLSAADAETSIAQLDTLTSGMGLETFKELQQFAAATPFELDEVTASAKTLLAAGVQLKAIPSTIGDLGEAAAATGTPLEQIATIFGQMTSKGKASFEELQQLAEAHLPVWTILADKLGLTVAQVQELATEGRLTADAIIVLQKALAQTYSGAMARQAETFNGKMSTFRDTVHQAGQQLGTVFLPEMKDALDMLQDVADIAGLASAGIADLAGDFQDWAHIDIVKALDPNLAGLDLLAKAIDKVDDKLHPPGGARRIGPLDPQQQALDDLQAISDEAQDAAQHARELQDAFKDALDAFQGIGEGVRARVDFIIDRDDLEEEIHKAVTGTENDAPVELPANLRIGQVSGLEDTQQDLVKNLSEFATQGLEEGARRADLARSLGTTFDAEAFYRDIRGQLKPLVIEAGVDPHNVNRFLQNVLGVPAPWQVEPEVTGVHAAQAAINDAFPPHVVPIDVRLPPRAREAMEASLGIGLSQDGTVADITTNVVGADQSRHLIDDVATPDGKDRTAWIDVKVRPSGDLLSLPGGLPGGGLSGLVSPDAVDRMVHPTTTLTPASRASVTDRRAPERAPRVQVLIDGEEIATHLERRGRQLSTTGGKRNP